MANINKKNWNEFLKETGLYVAEPLVNAVETWRIYSDIPDSKKARIFYFQTIEKEKMYVAFFTKNEQNYAKLYIVDGKTIGVLYMRSNAVNPVRKYHHVTRRKPE